jgi:hypothetical protein
MPGQNDAWLDPRFSQLDTRARPGDSPTEEIETPIEVNTEPQNPFDNLSDDEVSGLMEKAKGGVPDNTPVAPVNDTPQPVDSNAPEVIDLGDGSTVTIEHFPDKIQATLDPGTGGGREVFHARTETELNRILLVAKINASNKIRELNQEIKTTRATPASKPRVVRAPVSQTKELSADEIFTIKTELATNPDLALEKWFQLKTGLSTDQLSQMAKQGKEASLEQMTAAVSQEFVSENPDYWPVRENYDTLLRYLVQKYNVGFYTKQGQDICDSMLEALANNNVFTLDNLNLAFVELSEGGFLLMRDENEDNSQDEDNEGNEESVNNETAPQKPQPAETNRIVRPAGRPTAPANFGIRVRDSRGPVETEKSGLSDEDLDNLSDEGVANLMQQVRHYKVQTRR